METDISPRRERAALRTARYVASWPIWARRLYDVGMVALLGWQFGKGWWLWREDHERAAFQIAYGMCLAVLAWVVWRYEASLLLLVKLGALDRRVAGSTPPAAPAVVPGVSGSAGTHGLLPADARRLALAHTYESRLEPLVLFYAVLAAAPLVTVGLALAALELPRSLELAVVASGAFASGAAASALRLPGWMRLALKLERGRGA